MNRFLEGYRYLCEGSIAQARDIFCELLRDNHSININPIAVDALDRPGSAAAHAEIAAQIKLVNDIPRRTSLLDEIIQLTLFLGRLPAPDALYTPVKIPNASYLMIHKIRSTNDRESARLYLMVLSCLYFLETGELYYALEVYREHLGSLPPETNQALATLGRVNEIISEMIKGIEIVLSKHLYLSQDDSELPSSFTREIHNGLLYYFRTIFRNYQSKVLNKSNSDDFRLRYSDLCLDHINITKNSYPTLSEKLYSLHFVEAHIRILQLTQFVSFDVSREIIMPDSDVRSRKNELQPNILSYDKALELFSKSINSYLKSLENFLQQSYSRYSHLGVSDKIYLNENVFLSINNQIKLIISMIEEYHEAGASTTISHNALSKLNRYLQGLTSRVISSGELSGYPLKHVERRLGSSIKSYIESFESDRPDVNDPTDLAVFIDQITQLHKLSKEVVRHVRMEEILHSDTSHISAGNALRRFYYNPTYKLAYSFIPNHFNKICNIDDLSNYYKRIQSIALDDASLSSITSLDSTEFTKEYFANMNYHIDAVMRLDKSLIELISYCVITLDLENPQNIKKIIIDYVDSQANGYEFLNTIRPMDKSLFFLILKNHTVSTTNQSLLTILESFVLKLITCRILHRRIEYLSETFSAEILGKAKHFHTINHGRMRANIGEMSEVDTSAIDINLARTAISGHISRRANMNKLNIVDESRDPTNLLPKFLVRYAGEYLLLKQEMREHQLIKDLEQAKRRLLDAQDKSKREIAAAQQLGLVLDDASSVTSNKVQRVRSDRTEFETLVRTCILDSLKGYDTWSDQLTDPYSPIVQVIHAITKLTLNRNDFPYRVYLCLDVGGDEDARLIAINYLDPENVDCEIITKTDVENMSEEIPQFYISVSGRNINVEKLNQNTRMQYQR